MEKFHGIQNVLPPQQQPAANKKKSGEKKGGGKKRKQPIVAMEPLDTEKSKPRRDATHVTGDQLHLIYRIQPVRSHGANLSLVDEEDDILCFRQYPKLSKRFIVWCYPRESAEDLFHDPTASGGFPRPELIPIASLFRQPKGESSKDIK